MPKKQQPLKKESAVKSAIDKVDTNLKLDDFLKTETEQLIKEMGESIQEKTEMIQNIETRKEELTKNISENPESAQEILQKEYEKTLEEVKVNKVTPKNFTNVWNGQFIM